MLKEEVEQVRQICKEEIKAAFGDDTPLAKSLAKEAAAEAKIVAKEAAELAVKEAKEAAAEAKAAAKEAKEAIKHK